MIDKISKINEDFWAEIIDDFDMFKLSFYMFVVPPFILAILFDGNVLDGKTLFVQYIYVIGSIIPSVIIGYYFNHINRSTSVAATILSVPFVNIVLLVSYIKYLYDINVGDQK